MILHTDMTGLATCYECYIENTMVYNFLLYCTVLHQINPLHLERKSKIWTFPAFRVELMRLICQLMLTDQLGSSEACHQVARLAVNWHGQALQTPIIIKSLLSMGFNPNPSWKMHNACRQCMQYESPKRIQPVFSLYSMPWNPWNVIQPLFMGLSLCLFTNTGVLLSRDIFKCVGMSSLLNLCISPSLISAL